MEVEVEEEGDEFIKLELTGANPAIANSLRRAMIAEVPTLSVKELEITDNGSALFDELLASRVGQVPFEIEDSLDEEDEVHVAAKVEGPGSFVASDIQTDRDIEPVEPDALIVELKEDQDIEFEGTATLSRGGEHAKHQGGTVGYEKTGEGEFLFRIETTSGYSNSELFNEGVEELKRQLNNFEEAVKNL